MPRLPLWMVLVPLLLAGCETLPEGPPAGPPFDAAARELLAGGQYVAAAESYLALALAARGEAQLQYRIAAAAAFVQGGAPERGRALLAELPRALPPALAAHRTVVEAALELADGRAAEALRRLPAGPDEQLPREVARSVHRVRAQAFEELGNPFEAARERVLLDFLLDHPAPIAENRRALWDGLSRLTPEALDAARLPPPDTLGGWIELAVIAKRYIADPGAFRDAMDRWRQRYPGHPGGLDIVPELMESSAALGVPPRRVALLLPLVGRFAAAGAAVRDGFLAAWYADAGNAERPVVSIYDSNAAPIDELYGRAVAQGADFVVGPLDKDAVTTLAANDALPVPTLALNFAEPAPAPATEAGVPAPSAPAPAPPVRLFQFALSPEGEAREVAEHAWFDGHANAAVIVPEGAWGERMAGAFAEAWARLGGQVVSAQRYAPDAKDMSGPVEQFLAVDLSERRARALRAYLLRDIEYEPRRRQDVDFIFMAAFPQQARQLRPQFKFHQASDLPVYSTSHAFSGVRDAAADRDIDGLRFGDSPWVLLTEGPAAELHARLAALWPESQGTLTRLYAFGVDAYHLMPRLGRLRAQQIAEFDGVTGRLRVDPTNHVRRRLTWARFEGGVPRIEAATAALDVPSP